METSVGCSTDYIKFFDGLQNFDPILYRGCSNKGFEPIKIRSTGRHLTLLFHTDEGRVRKNHGFYYLLKILKIFQILQNVS